MSGHNRAFDSLLKRACMGISILSMALVIGCATPFTRSEFCLSAAINTFQKSDGPSAPIDLTLTAASSVVVVQVAGQWEAGTVSLEIWDEFGVPIWNAPVQKSTTAQEIRSVALKAGKYRLVNVANEATQGEICMLDRVEPISAGS